MEVLRRGFDADLPEGMTPIEYRKFITQMLIKY